MQIFQKVKNGGMSICVSCAHRKVCRGIENQPCVECNQFQNEDKNLQTNADRIRAMIDAEQAFLKVREENKTLRRQLEIMTKDRDYYRDAYHHLLREGRE